MLVKINNSEFKVKVCNSPREIATGMMNRNFTDFNGMLFFMKDKLHSFWMKNCIIPLDIIFIDNNLIITSIHHNCEPCESEPCDNYEGKGKYVLEVPSGTCKTEDINEGDNCEFIFEIQNH